MPPATRKRVAPAPRKVEPVKTLTADMDFERTTPGTVVFKEIGPPAEHVSGSLYIKKGQLDGIDPARIEVIINVYSK